MAICRGAFQNSPAASTLASENDSRSERLQFIVRVGFLAKDGRQALTSILSTNPMKRHALTFGIIGGVLIAALKWSEFRFLVIEHSFEIYGGLIAAIFAILGIWLGIKLTARRPGIAEPVVKVPARVVEADEAQTQDQPTQAVPGVSFIPDEKKREDLGITRRELEVLELIAQGMSNREIAGKLFVSENTVKTHSSRVLDKLGAKRRTQAVQFGKELGLLP